MIRSPECAMRKAPMHLLSVRSVTKCTWVIVSWWFTYNRCTRDCDHTSVNIAMRHTLSEVTVRIWYLKFMRYYSSDAASSLRRSHPLPPKKEEKRSTQILAIFHYKPKVLFLNRTALHIARNITKLLSYFFFFFSPNRDMPFYCNN